MVCLLFSDSCCRSDHHRHIRGRFHPHVAEVAVRFQRLELRAEAGIELLRAGVPAVWLTAHLVKGEPVDGFFAVRREALFRLQIVLQGTDRCPGGLLIDVQVDSFVLRTVTAAAEHLHDQVLVDLTFIEHLGDGDPEYHLSQRNDFVTLQHVQDHLSS